MSNSEPSFYSRYARWVVLFAGLSLPLVFGGSYLAMQTNHNDVKEWLPESFAETQEYNEFQRDFSNDTYVLCSWQGCTLDDPRLPEFAERMRSAGLADPEGGKFCTQVITGESVLEQLTGPPTKIPRQEVIERLTGSLIGPDGQQTCAVLTISKFGKDHLRSLLQTLETTAAECHIPRHELHLAGPPVDNVAIDEVSEKMREPLMVLAGVLGLGLSWWYLRDVRLTIMVFLCGGYGATFSLALVAFTGGIMNSVLFSMPAVVYTSGLSAAIHLVNYYRFARARVGESRAAAEGLKAAFVPCLLSAGTTSLGLISLCTSAIVPIRTFGFYTAIGVMSAVGLVFLYLPAALYLWPPAQINAAGADERSTARNICQRQRMRWLGSLVIARPLWVWATFMVILVVCGSGLIHVKTTVNLFSLFSRNAPIIESYRWLEEKLGYMVPMEIVIRLDEHACKLTFVERLEFVDRVQQAIERIPKNVGRTMSAATFVPDLTPPKRSGLGGALLTKGAWRRVLEKRLEAHRDELLGDYLAENTRMEEQLWRISIRVAALADVDYGQFIHDLRAHVDPVVEAEQKQSPGIVGVTYTGLVPVVYKAERELLYGLGESFIWAFLMMAAIMTVVFRDVRAGLYTMLPNVWPIGVVFGIMSWLGIALDIGTMMTASVAMGVCVDDTVHFANWFRRAIRQGLDRPQAVIAAYENAAGAIYQSTVIVALGLAIFALSEFMPTRRFGYLMGILLCFGLVADLVLSPAMLSGPVGRYFTRNCEPEPNDDEFSDTPATNSLSAQGD